MMELSKERKVILWGCGDGGAYAYEQLKDKLNIEAFGDSNPMKEGTKYFAKPVFLLRRLLLHIKMR